MNTNQANNNVKNISTQTKKLQGEIEKKKSEINARNIELGKHQQVSK